MCISIRVRVAFVKVMYTLCNPKERKRYENDNDVTIMAKGSLKK